MAKTKREHQLEKKMAAKQAQLTLSELRKVKEALAKEGVVITYPPDKQ